jgi:hypothetical protein
VDRLTAAGRVLVVVLAIDVAIGLAHLINLNGMPIFDRSLRFFDLGGEQNLPTWWSAVKLFLVGALLALLLPRLAADRRSFLVIGAAALAFAFLSLDELASIHEFIGRRTRFDGLPVSGLWPFLFGVAGIAVVAVLVVAGRPIWAKDRMAAACIVGGLAAYVLFAASLDLVVNLGPSSDPLVAVISFFEEMGEMIAASVMLYGAWRLVGPVATGTYR